MFKGDDDDVDEDNSLPDLGKISQLRMRFAWPERSFLSVSPGTSVM